MKETIKNHKLFIITLLVIAIVFHIKLPYYISAPGGVININNRIKYEEKKDWNGSFNMLYVTEYIATIPTYLLSYIIPDWDLESIKENQVSNETPEEINIRNRILLENSINTAKYIAYKEAGKEIKELSKKNIIIGTTLDNGLKIGDEVTEVNDKKVNTADDIREEIKNHEVGEKIKLTIIRNQKEINKEVEIIKKDNSKMIGILVVTNYKYEMNPEIELKFKKSESGSSGGLMMSLSIYSAISGEDLLKGRKIAGTGTIENDGSIGEIDGIKYKIIGAHKNNIDIVLVPEANYKEAKEVVKDKKYKIKVIKVKTLKEAIEYLKNS